MLMWFGWGNCILNPLKPSNHILVKAHTYSITITQLRCNKSINQCLKITKGETKYLLSEKNKITKEMRETSWSKIKDFSSEYHTLRYRRQEWSREALSLRECMCVYVCVGWWYVPLWCCISLVTYRHDSSGGSGGRETGRYGHLRGLITRPIAVLRAHEDITRVKRIRGGRGRTERNKDCEEFLYQHSFIY